MFNWEFLFARKQQFAVPMLLLLVDQSSPAGSRFLPHRASAFHNFTKQYEMNSFSIPSVTFSNQSYLVKLVLLVRNRLQYKNSTVASLL